MFLRGLIRCCSSDHARLRATRSTDSRFVRDSTAFAAREEDGEVDLAVSMPAV
jgi:hypothetical protein